MINQFYCVVSNLYTVINKLFTKKMIFLLIVSKVDIKLKKNLKVEYFCTKSLSKSIGKLRQVSFFFFNVLFYVMSIFKKYLAK